MEKSIEDIDQNKTMILTEDIPKYGSVSMLFYIPKTVKNRDTFIELIKKHGGNIVLFHESFTYQLGPPEKTEEHKYYAGDVYSFQWITDSIESNTLADKTQHRILTVPERIEFPFQSK